MSTFVAERRAGPFGPRWLPWVLFVGIPVWWVLGVGGMIAPILAVAAGIALVVRGWSFAPRGFGVWLLFVVWVVIAMLQVPDLERGVAAGYRLAHYLAGTVFFLYVFNAPRDVVPIQAIVRALAVFWVVVVVGGLIGIFAPSVTFRTPMEAVLPASLQSEGLVGDLVTASTSSEDSFPGLGLHRPKAPFPYTNQWGAVFAATLPFGIAALALTRKPLARKVFGGAIALSVVPLVFSLDRGAWLSVSAGFAYAVFRLFTRGTRQRRSTNVVLLLVAGLLIGSLVIATPLRDIVLVRLERGYGDESRWTLYSESIALAKESPLFGHGSPVAIPGLPSAGTHGHLWTVLVSFGMVGLALFMLWFVQVIWRTRRPPPGGSRTEQISAFWCHVSIVIAAIQLPYYELLPWGLPIVMVSAAAVMRERVALHDVAPGGWSPSRLDGRTQVAVRR